MVKGNSRRWRRANLEAALSPRWRRGGTVRRKNKAEAKQLLLAYRNLARDSDFTSLFIDLYRV
jgi:hypothetical protein